MESGPSAGGHVEDLALSGDHLAIRVARERMPDSEGREAEREPGRPVRMQGGTDVRHRRHRIGRRAVDVESNALVRQGRRVAGKAGRG